MLTHDAHGILGIPTAVWFGILPDSGGINTIFRLCSLCQIPKNGSPDPFSKLQAISKESISYPRYNKYELLLGVPIPKPSPLVQNKPLSSPDGLLQTSKKHGACLIITLVSNALRICLAAKEEGIDLTGAVLWAGGEPPTPAKIREITGVGAQWIPGYWITEMGPIGMGCSQPIDVNDIHLFKDLLVVIPHTPSEMQGSYSVFYFTSLLPTAPKILLNVESDDCGIIETRSWRLSLRRLRFYSASSFHTQSP